METLISNVTPASLDEHTPQSQLTPCGGFYLGRKGAFSPVIEENSEDMQSFLESSTSSPFDLSSPHQNERVSIAIPPPSTVSRSNRATHRQGAIALDLEIKATAPPVTPATPEQTRRNTLTTPQPQFVFGKDLPGNALFSPTIDLDNDRNRNSPITPQIDPHWLQYSGGSIGHSPTEFSPSSLTLARNRSRSVDSPSRSLVRMHLGEQGIGHILVQNSKTSLVAGPSLELPTPILNCRTSKEDMAVFVF